MFHKIATHFATEPRLKMTGAAEEDTHMEMEIVADSADGGERGMHVVREGSRL